MFSKTASFGILATMALLGSANAACSFRARSDIFPSCASGMSSRDCPFSMSESESDDNMQIHLNWNGDDTGAFKRADNKYYLLDIASNGGTDNTQTVDYAVDDELTDDGSVYHTVALTEPGTHVDCADEGCTVTSFVSVMIGAAPDCGGTISNANHVYARAVYKFKITQSWARVDGAVNLGDWNDVVTTTAFITQADEVKARIDFTANTMQVVDDFTLVSALDIVDDNNEEQTLCLGDGESASFSDTSDSNTVSDDNGLGECHGRAKAYILQISNTGSAGTTADDEDVMSTPHDDYNDDGGVAIYLSQYSQVNSSADNGDEITATTKPTSFAVSDSTAVASGGNDFRWDVAQVTAAATAAHGSTAAQVETFSTAADTSPTAAYRTALITELSSDRVRALAAVKYTLVAPPAPAAAAQSPVIYLGAWFTHSIPTESEYNVDHDDLDNYTPTQRRLLRSAASKKLATPKKVNRGHIITAHFVNHK